MSDIHKTYPENLDAAVDAYVAARANYMMVEAKSSCSLSMLNDALCAECMARDALVALCVKIAAPNEQPPAQ